MRSTMPPLRTQRPEWTALSGHHQEIQHLHLRDLFAEDPRHGERLTAEAAGLYLDYSKHRITDKTLDLLVQLAEATGLRDHIEAICRGDHINAGPLPHLHKFIERI